jgi:hypothetical protein
MSGESGALMSSQSPAASEPPVSPADPPVDPVALTKTNSGARMLGAWWTPAVGLAGVGLFGSASVARGDVAGRESFFNVAQPWAV